jgi:phosphate transport system substrate-binding protein
VVGAAVLALALAAAACGTDDNTPHGSATAGAGSGAGATDHATLSGAGATFPATLVQEWIKQYRSVAPGVTVNYQPVGSGAGIQQLTAKTVDFAGSDVTLKDSEKAATGGPGSVVQVPWVAGGLAVEYNLAEVKGLRLSPGALAAIFAGSITRWDDPAVRADNPGVRLPASGIQVVHRADGSGTTQVFTEYLKAVAPDVWAFPVGKDWPAGTAGTGAKGSDGVTAAVKQSTGAIGYAELSFPHQAGLGIVAVRNRAGQYVTPTAAGISAALGSATVNPDMTLRVDYVPAGAGAYPISTASYLMYYRSAEDEAKLAALKHFAAWALTQGQRLSEGLDYAPLPQSVTAPALGLVTP